MDNKQCLVWGVYSLVCIRVWNLEIGILSLNKLWDLLRIILFGTLLVFSLEVLRLFSQYPAFSRKINGNGVIPEGLVKFLTIYLELLGLFIMVAGFSLLFWQLLKLPDPQLPFIQQMFFMAFIFLIFLGIGCVSWVGVYYGKRRAKQNS